MDFGSGSSKSRIWPFFGNPAKSGSGQISCRMDLADTSAAAEQLITDKTNAADLSSSVFTILISVTQTKNIYNPLPFHKFR